MYQQLLYFGFVVVRAVTRVEVKSVDCIVLILSLPLTGRVTLHN